MQKLFFPLLAGVVRNIGLLIGAAAIFAFGQIILAHAGEDRMPMPMRVFQIFIVLWSAFLPILHQDLRERVRTFRNCPATVVERMRLSYSAQQLFLNNVGISGMALVAFVYGSSDLFSYALAAGCVTMNLVSGAVTYRCLYGKHSRFRAQPASAQA
jgi:hypothetical protein